MSVNYNKCDKCQGYLFAPYTTNFTEVVRVCQCPKEQTLSWKCIRCNKINAPWKSSCDCLPGIPSMTNLTCSSKFVLDEGGVFPSSMNFHDYWDKVAPKTLIKDPTLNVRIDEVP